MSTEIRSSRTRDLLQGEKESEMTVGLSIAPLPSTITVNLKVSLLLTVDYRKEINKSSQINGQ